MVLIVLPLITALTVFVLWQIEGLTRRKACRELRECLLLECPEPHGNSSDDDRLTEVINRIQGRYSVGIGNFDMAWPNGVGVQVAGRYDIPYPPQRWEWVLPSKETTQ